MKLHLSIFSFRTLRGTRIVFPRALFVCLCLVCAAEITARVLVQSGKIGEAPSASKMIRDRVVELRDQNPECWLIGNSTLEFAIRPELLQKQANLNCFKLCHGSATVRGAAAMLQFYLGAVGYLPETVILFMTKDDINLNGFGARVSNRYLEYQSWRKYFKMYSYLRAVRHDLNRLYKRVWARLLVDERHRAQWLQKNDILHIEIDPKKIAAEMMHDYAIDASAISNFAKICRSIGPIKNVILVLLPVAEHYIEWHDRKHPETPYKYIRSYIAGQCEENNITFLDLGTPPPGQGVFNDYIHVTPAGAAMLTEKFFHYCDLRIFQAPVVNSSTKN